MGIKIVASGMLLSELFTFELSLLNFEFLTTSLLTTTPNSFKSTILKLSKPVKTVTNLLSSSLSTTPFHAVKSLTNLAAKLRLTPLTPFNYF